MNDVREVERRAAEVDPDAPLALDVAVLAVPTDEDHEITLQALAVARD